MRAQVMDDDEDVEAVEDSCSDEAEGPERAPKRSRTAEPTAPDDLVLMILDVDEASPGVFELWGRCWSGQTVLVRVSGWEGAGRGRSLSGAGQICMQHP